MLRKIRVMIVDDHELVRSGISRLLSDNSDIEIIAEARTGEEAVHSVRTAKPDVIIMDIKMPGIGGLEATHKLIRMKPGIKILILSVCTEHIFPNKLLKAGAFGYITKGSSSSEMIRAIRTIHGGNKYISPEIASTLALNSLQNNENSPFDELSDRELQVTIMICEGKKVQSIADSLCLSPKTINSYRYRIFEKLGIENDVSLTHMALKHGVLETDKDDELA